MFVPIEGGCFCGAIRYRIGATIIEAAICHCSTCRRAAGAQSVAWLTVPVTGFALVAGQPETFASSPGIERCHCRDCGTSLTYRSGSETVDVTIASLDNPETVTPTREIWLEHRLAWEPIDPSRPGLRRG